MTVYTMGFTQKSAEKFFSLIGQNGIQILVDVRLNNRSQLAGFTKGDDLAYFLEKICACRYAHREEFAPTKEILDGYKKGVLSWEDYEALFLPLMEKRNAAARFFRDFGKYDRVLLLCSEPTPERCHRRLLAELFADFRPGTEIVHI